MTQRGGGGHSGEQLGHWLRDNLKHLGDEAYRERMDAAMRLCSSSMYHQARQANAFKGDQAELFLASLIDALEGLLSAPESNATKTLRQRLSLRG